MRLPSGKNTALQTGPVWPSRLASRLAVGVTHALAASFPKLKAVATTFYANLVELQKQSNDACFEFISQGEASSTAVILPQRSPHVAHLQAQLTAVFEAIADGRTAARVYPQPRKSDYDALASDLTQRGWTQPDMQLFSDERALAHAGAAKVCQMVHDWFAAQLGIKDADCSCACWSTH